PQAFDYIADFVEDIACDKIVEDMEAQVVARVLDTESQASGNQIKIQSVIELLPRSLESCTNDFLVAADGALTQKTTQVAQQFVAKINDNMQIEDALETGMTVDEVLLFDCRALLAEAEMSKGDIVASGRCSCEIVYVSGGKIFNQNMCLPFVRTLGEGGAHTRASVDVAVKESKLVIEGTDKENVLRAEVTLQFCGNIFETQEVELVEDIFCPTQNLSVDRKNIAFELVEPIVEVEEKISGSVESDNKDCVIKKVVAQSIVQSSVDNVFVDNGVVVCEGLVVAAIMFEDDEEKLNCMQIELPYSLQSKQENDLISGNLVGQCLVCDLSTKIKRGKEVELDATILISIFHNSPRNLCGIVAVEEGEEIKQKRCGISILIPKSGQTMWDVAKQLAMPIEEIKMQNQGI
ncbi:MAG: hypothetical protein RR348_05415, partial [Clostridia bacterium]